jgi:hypothetical protein
MIISENSCQEKNDNNFHKKIENKEELFFQISEASSYFHVLTIFNNSKHLLLTKAERVNLFVTANNRLKHLQMSGTLTTSEKDSYFRNFIIK